MSEAQDRQVVRDAEQALDALFERYADADPADQWLLKPAITKASEELLAARLALFKDGVLSKPGDIEKLGRIKQEIDSAADAQALLMSAMKLAAFLGAFA